MGRPSVVLVTGAGGQVGTALRARLGSARFLGRSDLDITDQKAVRTAARGADLVVHLAAMTNVDECEARPDAAFAVNAWSCPATSPRDACVSIERRASVRKRKECRG